MDDTRVQEDGLVAARHPIDAKCPLWTLRAKEGAGPAGIVLLDTYEPGHDEIATILPELISDMVEASEDIAPNDYARLTGMGWYFRLFADWEPEAVSAPTLFVRPKEPLRDRHHQVAQQAVWPLPHRSAAVSANHFTITGDAVAATAAKVAAWMDELRIEASR